LCSGLTRANTDTARTVSSSLSSDIASSSAPVTARPSDTPSSAAITEAVAG
jgi:hypothetical protein